MTVDDVYRVRIWFGYPESNDRNRVAEVWGEPDEVVEVEEETPHVWQEDPRFRNQVGIDLHPEDAPASLDIYTSDSIHSPPGSENHVEKGYWDGPIERGFEYPENHDYPPFGAEIAGRVMFFVEGVESR